MVELDRFCDGCAYNLRTQAVFRDAGTGLWLVRCPDCGRLHPAQLLTTAGRAWLFRLATLGLFVWIIAFLALAAIGTIALMGVQVGTFEELTSSWGVARHYDWSLEQKGTFLAFVSFVSLAIPFVGVTGLSIAAHHWARWGYALVALLIPILPLVIAVGVVRKDAPHLQCDAAWHLGGHWAIQTLGGLTGAFFGRPAARLLATLFIPPSVRPVLAFLWHADGKPGPSARKAGARRG